MNIDSAELFDLSERILGILLQTDESHPISRHKLLDDLHLPWTERNERMVRRIIHENLTSDYPIGSNSNGKSAGYYLCRTREGVEQARAEYISRATQCFDQADKLSAAFAMQNSKCVQGVLPGVLA